MTNSTILENLQMFLELSWNLSISNFLALQMTMHVRIKTLLNTFQNRGVYMFRIDDNEVVDATMCGGPARYINHSCNPNCMAEVVPFGDENKIIIIAKRRIGKGEEVGVKIWKKKKS